MEDLENNFGIKSYERNKVIKVNKIKDIKSNNNIKYKSVIVLGSERKKNLKESNSIKNSPKDKKMNNNTFNFNMRRIQSSFFSSSSNMKSSRKKCRLPIIDDKQNYKNTSEIL